MGTKPVESFGVRRLADGKTVWSWHPLLVLNLWRRVGRTRLRQAISTDDGDNNEFVAEESPA